VLQRYRGKILEKFFYIKVNIMVYSELSIVRVSIVTMTIYFLKGKILTLPKSFITTLVLRVSKYLNYKSCL
jgi:hypothetical protein